MKQENLPLLDGPLVRTRSRNCLGAIIRAIELQGGSGSSQLVMMEVWDRDAPLKDVLGMVGRSWWGETSACVGLARLVL